MTMRRCPQCKNINDDKYGFCIKCGFEYPKTDEQNTQKICVKCGKENPEEATHCVNCGTPLNINELFKNYEVILQPNSETKSNNSSTNKIIIILGYIFSILGGLIGLIIAIYLLTRKDSVAKKHGTIQIVILAIWFIIGAILILTGTVDLNTLITNYSNMTNSTNLTNLTYFK